MFVALIGSLLTAVPLSPAGLGIVEAGHRGRPHARLRGPLPEATAIALLDRVISVFSVIVFGSILYAVSGQAAGQGHRAQRREAPVPGRLSRLVGRVPDLIPRTGYARTAHDRTTPHGRADAGAPALSTNGWLAGRTTHSTLQSSRARHAGT